MIDSTWRVLIVDDSAVTTKVVGSILRQCGFNNIEIAESGRSALEMMSERSFDLVLCDWEMPVMDGVSVLRQIRQDPTLRHTRFILMSARKEPRWVQLAKDAEADSLIAKPFDADALKQKIGQLPVAIRR